MSQDLAHLLRHRVLIDECFMGYVLQSRTMCPEMQAKSLAWMAASLRKAIAEAVLLCAQIAEMYFKQVSANPKSAAADDE